MKDVCRTVLVVDGDSAALRELAGRLAPPQVRVATCPRWDVALEYVAENAPDVVLSDAESFYAEGRGLLERIRAASPRTRVIFLDSDGAWSVFLEPPGGDGAVTLINPCRRDELVRGAMEAVDTEARRPRSAEETWA